MVKKRKKKRGMSRKAQMRMFENIAVIIVFFFLLMFGVSFYFMLQRAAYQKDLERNLQLQSIQMAQKVSNLPELDCSTVGVQVDNCFDLVKVEEFATMLEEDQTRIDYFLAFGYSQVVVRSVYPTTENYILYDRELPDFSDRISTFVPILLFDPLFDTYSFGVLEVRMYAK